MGVLMVLVVWDGYLTVPQIASSLDVDPDDAEDIVNFGAAQSLLFLYPDGDIRLPLQLTEFLQDADRAGEFYIPPYHLNPNYDSLYAKIDKIRSG